MPSLRVLLVHLFPKILGTSQRSGTGYYVNNSNSRALDNALTSRSRHRSINRPLDKSGTLVSQSYGLDHESSWDQDESHLALDDLDGESLSSTVPASNISGIEFGTDNIGVRPIQQPPAAQFKHI